MKNKLLRRRLLKILERDSPLTTQQIKSKLIQMDDDINKACNKNYRVGSGHSSNSISQTLSKDLRFEKMGTTSGTQHVALWGLRNDQE